MVLECVNGNGNKVSEMMVLECVNGNVNKVSMN